MKLNLTDRPVYDDTVILPRLDDPDLDATERSVLVGASGAGWRVSLTEPKGNGR